MTKSQKITLAVVMVSSFIATFTGSALNLSIPDMGEEFSVSGAMVGWVMTAYILSATAFSVPFGRLADLKGRKRVFTAGIFVFGLSALCCVFAWNIWALLVFRVIQGIGCAMIFSGNQPILISSFPPEQKGKMLGRSVAATYIGLSMGPVVGGNLNHYFGWRSIFIVTALISLGAFLLSYFRLEEPAADLSEKIEQKGMDLQGSLLFISMIVLMMYGLSSFAESWYAKGMILAGILLFFLFVWHEKRTASPVVRISLFTENKSYLCANLAALMNYGATYALGYILSIYLQVVRGYDSQISGLILIFQPVVQAILSPYAGKLSDKRSPFRLSALGMLFCAIGLATFLPIQQNDSVVRIIISLMIVGFGFAFFTSPNTNAVMSGVTSKDYGVASSMLSAMRYGGQTVSMAIVTFIVSTRIGGKMLTEASPGDIVSIIRVTFFTFTIICLAGAIISLVSGGKRSK